METKPNLEKNKDFAHTTAIFLNGLMDRGVLTSRDLAHATHEVISELVLRIHSGRMPSNVQYLDIAHMNKIERIFKSENVIDADMPSKEEVLSFADEFLYYLQENNYPDITGMIIFGSLVTEGKISGYGSDLDVVFLVNKNTNVVHHDNLLLHSEAEDPAAWEIPISSSYESVPRKMRNFAKDKGYTKFINILLSINMVLNRELFEKEFNPNSTREVLTMLRFSDAYAVGNLSGMSQKDLNIIIKKYKDSGVVQKDKEKTILAIRKNAVHPVIKGLYS